MSAPSDSGKWTLDGGVLVSTLEAEIARLRGLSPSGSKNFQSLLDHLGELEHLCSSEAEGAREVAKAAGVFEAFSQLTASKIPQLSETAHSTGVTFSSASHIA